MPRRRPPSARRPKTRQLHPATETRARAHTRRISARRWRIEPMQEPRRVCEHAAGTVQAGEAHGACLAADLHRRDDRRRGSSTLRQRRELERTPVGSRRDDGASSPCKSRGARACACGGDRSNPRGVRRIPRCRPPLARRPPTSRLPASTDKSSSAQPSGLGATLPIGLIQRHVRACAAGTVQSRRRTVVASPPRSVGALPVDVPAAAAAAEPLVAD